MAQDTIKLLPWDTDFFGRRIAALEVGETLPDAPALDRLCRQERIALLQACVDTSDEASIYALEELGFHFVDLRLNLSGAVAGGQPEPAVTLAGKADIPALLMAARGGFTEISRYNWRGFFPPEKVDAFYATWLENGVRGKFDDCCLKCELDGEVAGFVTLKAKNNEAAIGIIGAAPGFRGRGVGDRLLCASHAWAAERNLTRITTATQGRNSYALGLFLRHGLKLQPFQSWYYRKC